MSVIKITNLYLDNINWLSHTNCNYIIENGTIDNWRINIGSNLSNLDYFTSLLTTEEIARGNKYYQLKDKNRFIVSRGALRYILGRYLQQHPALITFSLSDNKKPFVESELNLQFNVSHSADWVLIAISNAAIGVDIEFINPNFSYTDVLEGNFNTAEINQVTENKSPESFFKFWTRKEAITKTTCRGLDEYLKMIPATDGTYFADSAVISSAADLFVNTFKPAADYIASVCCNDSVNHIRFWDIDF